MLSSLQLIRHGPSTHPQGKHWVDGSGFQRWRDAYDETGIDPTAAPPASTVDAIAAADIVVCSDLRRARETAARLAPMNRIVETPLFRETLLDIPAWVPLRLPVSAWDGLTHVQWGFGILVNADASQRDRKRADDAIAWLQALGNSPTAIAVITHGVFRRLLATRLLEHGWHTKPGRRSYKPWSVWKLTRKQL